MRAESRTSLSTTAFGASFEELVLVIAHHGPGPERRDQIEHAPAVGPARHEIPDEVDGIVGGRPDAHE
ncbi:hypothetical protein D3C83_126170 [compost metagenome]